MENRRNLDSSAISEILNESDSCICSTLDENIESESDIDTCEYEMKMMRQMKELVV